MGTTEWIVVVLVVGGRLIFTVINAALPSHWMALRGARQLALACRRAR